MEKRKLEVPDELKEKKHGTGIRAKENEEELKAKREEARRRAQERAKARTLAKRQAMAERISGAAEQLLSGVEEASAAVPGS